MSKALANFTYTLLIFLFLFSFIYSFSAANSLGDSDLLHSHDPPQQVLDMKDDDSDFSLLEKYNLIDSQNQLIDVHHQDEINNIYFNFQSIKVNYKCPQHLHVASSAGWTEDLFEKLDYIIWRESRCLESAFNDQDPNGGSHGLVQINGFWCRPSRYNPDGWLQQQGILSSCQDLYDPYINLLAAKAIYDYSLERNKCGFSPWSTKKTSWC
jgi:hypothetical protein